MIKKRLLGFILIFVMTLGLANPFLANTQTNDMEDPEYWSAQGYISDSFYSEPTEHKYQNVGATPGRGEYTLRKGIDVSSWNYEIDWAKAKEAGVEFAIIRVGYRGYGTGKLVADANYIQNIEGALENDIQVGVYIYSQAISVEEAIEEAEFVMARVFEYDLDLPIVIDFEYYSGPNGNSGRLYNANLSVEAATEICSAFCDTVETAGYTGMVYANKYMLSNKIDGNKLAEDYRIWLAHYTAETDYSGTYDFWQYTSTGDGYAHGMGSNDVDLNWWYDDGHIDKEIVNVSYSTHVQNIGWQETKTNGAMSGTAGQSLRLEGIKIKVLGNDDLGIAYTTHVQDYGWMPNAGNGEMSGTEGEAKRLEAIMIQLTGKDAEEYDVYYRVHAQNVGWMGWAKDGAPAGTAGHSFRLEGIQIVVVPEGESFDQNVDGIRSVTTQAYISNSSDRPVMTNANVPNINYQTHVQNIGWQNYVSNGAMSGTSGLAYRLEGIRINLSNSLYNGEVRYITHVQNVGWQGDRNNSSTWCRNNEMAGTEGLAYRLEGIQIQLTGEIAEHYDVYYRVHVQNIGWMDWVKNGEMAGTEGMALRLEGIEIKLVEK